MNASTQGRARWDALTGRSADRLSALFAYLSRAAVLARIRTLLGAVLVLWLVLSLWRGLWSFYPEADAIATIDVINPAREAGAASARAEVDIDALVAAQLFGEPGASISEAQLAAAIDRVPAVSESETAEELAGIEDRASATRLPLLLRGVVASTDAGRGQAVIEHSKLQDLYQVGDELPVSGEVTLAKVLPTVVVLDNGGRYEVLRLFDDSALVRQQPVARAPATRGEPVSADQATAATADTARIAAQYRDRLYRDPESLADVVRVTAVREGTSLLGYRISPGSSAQEFAVLGFEEGDIVTGVNGLSLTDPANTVRLYQAMRSAQEANFELQRGGETVTLNVSIGGGVGERGR